jgi:hypothetical protein
MRGLGYLRKPVWGAKLFVPPATVNRMSLISRSNNTGKRKAGPENKAGLSLFC